MAASTARTSVRGALAGRSGMARPAGIWGDRGARPAAGWASAREATARPTAAAATKEERVIFLRERGMKGVGGGGRLCVLQRGGLVSVSGPGRCVQVLGGAHALA